MKIKYILTDSRIDEILIIYSIISDEFKKAREDELEFDFLFKKIMKVAKGHVNPKTVKEELLRI